MSTSRSQKDLMEYWSELTSDQKESLLSIARGYLQSNNIEKQTLKEDSEKYYRVEKPLARMEIKELILKVPKELNEKDIKLLIAGMLYEKAFFSSGQAAEYAGITKREFIETIGRHGFSIFNYAPSELARDISNA